MPIDTTSVTGVVGSPASCRDYMKLVHDATVALGRDIELKLETIRGTDAGENFARSYVEFLNRVAEFKDDASCWWASDFEQAESLAREYNAFEAEFIRLTGSSPSRPGATRPPGTFGWGWLFFAVAVAVGGYVAYRFVLKPGPKRRRRALAGARQVDNLGTVGTQYFLEV